MRKILIALRLNPPDLAVFQEIAAKRGATLSDTIREVLEFHVQGQLKKSPALTKLWQKALFPNLTKEKK
jgi:hypothetical protein